jgi:hypothetical protein
MKAMNDATLNKHILALAKETKTNREAVNAVTDDIATRMANKAAEVEMRVGHDGGENWLEMYLACNAAVNKHARAIIEHKSRIIYSTIMSKTTTGG